MFAYRLKCPCGYESNAVPYGSDSWSPHFSVPVVVQSEEVLQHLQVQKHDAESEDDFEQRLDRAIVAQAAEEFGDEAVVMTPLAIRGDQIVCCPRCGRCEARFQFTGF